MKKIVWICLLSSLLASDTITIDSLYKKQYGLRSITTLSILSSGNANTYSLYQHSLNVCRAASRVWCSFKMI